MIDTALIRQRFERVAPFLDERGRRLVAASEAVAAEHGGIAAVPAATGIAPSTIEPCCSHPRYDRTTIDKNYKFNFMRVAIAGYSHTNVLWFHIIYERQLCEFSPLPCSHDTLMLIFVASETAAQGLAEQASDTFAHCE